MTKIYQYEKRVFNPQDCITKMSNRSNNAYIEITHLPTGLTVKATGAKARQFYPKVRQRLMDRLERKVKKQYGQ